MLHGLFAQYAKQGVLKVIKYYKTIDNVFQEIKSAESGCWISIIAPNEEETRIAVERFGLDAGFVRSSLDEEESSRIENEDDQTLVIVDYPVAETVSEPEKTVNYYTLPLGIIVTADNIITICSRENNIISELSDGMIRNIQTNQKTRFLLQIQLRIAIKFLHHLKQIDKIFSVTEKRLSTLMKNKELLQLHNLEKSLVYFSTSLKSNEVTLEKILRGRVLKMYEEDKDLLEDVLIEVKQAIEMANIYSRILSGTRDAFSSIINNNLNNVMKRLTIITILMAIPTIVFSYYGMNVSYLPFDTSIIPVPLIISVAATAFTAFLLYRKE